MASTIAAITTGVGGVVTTADSSGNLSLLSGATTVVALTSTGATVTGTLAATGAVSGTTGTFTGVSTFPAGTALLPAITTTGDTNTGMWFPAADTIAASTGGTEAMRIDSSGRVKTPLQTGFIAKGLAAQAVYTSGQVVVFNSASYNVGSGYNTSTGAFTAPVDGLYLFTFQIYLNPGSTNFPIGFYKNAVMEIFILQGVSLNGIGLSSLISLSASDTVDVRVRVVGGATATIYNGSDHTQFTGRLLG